MLNRLSLRIQSRNSSTTGASKPTSKVSDLRSKYEDPSAVPAPLSLKRASQAPLAKSSNQMRQVDYDCKSIYGASEEEDLMAASPIDETLPSPREYAEFTRTNPFSEPCEGENPTVAKKQSKKPLPLLSIITRREKETEQEMLNRVRREFEQQHEKITAEEAAALKAFEALGISELRFQ